MSGSAWPRPGMTRDGVLRQAFPFNGELLDTEVWSLLADELPALLPVADG